MRQEDTACGDATQNGLLFLPTHTRRKLLLHQDLIEVPVHPEVTVTFHDASLKRSRVTDRFSFGQKMFLYEV